MTHKAEIDEKYGDIDGRTATGVDPQRDVVKEVERDVRPGLGAQGRRQEPVRWSRGEGLGAGVRGQVDSVFERTPGPSPGRSFL